MFIVRYVGLVLISDEDDDEEDEEEEEAVESSQTVRQRQVSILPPISPPSAVLHVVTSSHRSDVDGRSRAHVRSPVGNYESDRIMGSSGRSRGGSSSERPSSETRRRNNESADRDGGSSGERSVSQREGELRRRIKRPIRSPPSSLI